MKKIKSILVQGHNQWIKGKIEEVEKNGEMAKVIWYGVTLRDGTYFEFNGKYVKTVEYEKDTHEK